MVTATERNAAAYAYSLGEEPSKVLLLEKSNPVGAVTKEDIADALSEYDQQFRIGQISKAELLTLHRAYPSNQEYAQAALQKGIIGDEDSTAVVVGGPASVEMVDREGHLITMQAMQKAFDKFMSNNRTRNVMVLHSDVQVGWALPAYINSSGQIFKSGVNDDRLFLLSEIRDDTKISQRVVKQIEDGKLHSYSIAGSAIQTKTIQKGMMQYMQVDELEMSEITVCEQGVYQGANFDILKGHAYTGTCID